MIYLAWLGLVLIGMRFIKSFIDIFIDKETSERVAAFVVSALYIGVIYFFINYIFL